MSARGPSSRSRHPRDVPRGRHDPTCISAVTISVLVVDDDRTTRETLANSLVTLGHSVRTASSAAAARTAIAAEAPAVMLLDARLPDARGLTLIDELRANTPELGIIMLVGRTDVSVAIRAVKRGAIDFLEKPIDLQRLELVLDRTAEIVRLRRERSAPTVAHGAVQTTTTLAQAEHQAIRAALRTANGNRVHAARMLGIARSTLLEKLKRLPD